MLEVREQERLRTISLGRCNGIGRATVDKYPRGKPPNIIRQSASPKDLSHVVEEVKL